MLQQIFPKKLAPHMGQVTKPYRYRGKSPSAPRALEAGAICTVGGYENDSSSAQC